MIHSQKSTESINPKIQLFTDISDPQSEIYWQY
jgi:hypothetical protein